MAFDHQPDAVDRMVLWAPAVDLEPADEPLLTEDDLAEISLPVCILQGDEDRGFSVANAERLVEALELGNWSNSRARTTVSSEATNVSSKRRWRSCQHTTTSEPQLYCRESRTYTYGTV